ncbi:hypothetical protein PAHAL_1G262500 [Panicum hallii]|uniref:DUF295 domain-containing protein n=1 Tax=Panicum hallii TaxID=206008 RepID=A0A2T8KWH9_9POAL|nr:hypothetical protein PAHAL_1G262500 [Panicum hallii]
MAVAHDPAQPRGGNGGSFDVFDPVTKNRYTLSARVPGVTVPDDSASLMLHDSKDGWLLVSRCQYSFFLMNPFKRGNNAMVVLPPAHELFFNGISFCSTPGSHEHFFKGISFYSTPAAGVARLHGHDHRRILLLRPRHRCS